MDFSNIKNLVFDLGAVIINIDFKLTWQGFAALAGKEINDIIEQFEKEQYFIRYETGEMDEPEFFNLLRAEVCPDASDDQIRDAWNALLLDIPIERIDLLQDLREKYNLYLLSNTNQTHIDKVNDILFETAGIVNLDQLFEKVYYSYEIKMAKPDVEIYDYLAADSSFEPKETIFLDDNLANVQGAEKAGWNTIHVKSPQTILELLVNA
jgi:glucose-1-phosphatase